MSKQKNQIKSCKVFPLHIPLNQPFRTALGDHNALENVLFELTLADGTQGFGEAAVATHITGETVGETFKNLETVGASLVGRDASLYWDISKFLHQHLGNNPCALAAIEMGLVDALTRQMKIPLWKFFGPRSRKLTTDITIVIADLKETIASVKKYSAKGFCTFKVKIGRNEELDFERVIAVKRAVPKATIYLDANQGYSADQTLKLLKKLKTVGVRPALLEQPVPREDWAGLKRVTRLAEVPVCADESVRTMADAKRLIREHAAHVINIKLMKLGIFEAQQIAMLARRHNIGLMIGGMMESSIAMTAAAHLAVGLGGFQFIDLDTPFFLKKGFEKNPYLSSKGIYDLARVKAGIGINVVTPAKAGL